MAEPVIRLDRHKPHSECRGDCQPDDPHYQVRFWQGQKVGGHYVSLPFGSDGTLVPDDGKKEPWDGIVDGKPVKHYPLYTQAMRDLVERKKKSLGKAMAAADEANADEASEAAETEAAIDDLDWVAWLRGDVRYPPHIWRSAAKKRFSKTYSNERELVVDLVLDERLVPEDQVSGAFKKYLPAKAA